MEILIKFYGNFDKIFGKRLRNFRVIVEKYSEILKKIWTTFTIIVEEGQKTFGKKFEKNHHYDKILIKFQKFVKQFETFRVN